MQALILDFDGLILDTETAVFESWRSIYDEHGVTLPREEWLGGIGRLEKAFDPVLRLALLTGSSLDEPRLRASYRARRDAILARLSPLPGVIDWLESARARGLLLGVASSSSIDWVRGHLARLGLVDYFHELMTGDQATHLKPHPELYHRALAALGVAPSDALALEDSPNGVRAAKAAGLCCIAVPGPMTRELVFAEADLVLASLAEHALDQVLLRLRAAIQADAPE